MLLNARQGYRLGDGTLVDSMMYDGLTCSIEHIAMGVSTENFNAAAGSPASARTSSRPQSTSWPQPPSSGKLAEEIVPPPSRTVGASPPSSRIDEGVRGETTVESLGKLRPAFGKGDDAHRAGNASRSPTAAQRSS